jgi:DNA-binding phage protein
MTKAKSLQKFTDIEKIETKEQLQGFLKLNPKANEKMFASLLDRLNKSYNEKTFKDNNIMVLIEEFYLITEGINSNSFVKLKNATYEMNHSIITTCIHNHILEHRCFPTMFKIREETGISRTTIYKHLDEGLKSKFNKLVNGKVELMTTKAMEKLYLIGVQDNNVTALKNFIELSGATAKNNTTNNYIQINNLKISNDEFNQLPSETILEIETLISKNIKSKLD